MSFTTGTTNTVSPDRASRRLILGVLLSIVLHAIVLSLQFGIPGLGLPGIELPWNKRRAELTPLSVQLQVAPPPASVATALSATSRVPEVLPVQPDSAAVGIEPKTIRLQAYVPTPVVSLTQTKPAHKKKKAKAAPQMAVRPVTLPALRVPAAPREPIETPVRIIAQEQIRDDSFVVPMPSPEEPLHRSMENKKAPQKVEEIVAEPDEKNEVREAEDTRLAELALAKEREFVLAKQVSEAQRIREVQERFLAAQLAAQLAEQQVQKVEQAKQKQQAAKKLEEESRKDTEERVIQHARQQLAALAMQKQASEQIEQERRKRIEQQELEQREALQQEQQKRHEQQARELKTKEQQAALELARRQQAELAERQQLEQKLKLQEATRQRQIEELAAKQLAEQLSERQRADELARRKATDQKLTEQKLAEQKLAEQKLAEQRLAEQRLAEQKLAEQKLAEQKLAEQKLAEQKLAEQKIAEQKLAEQKERERASQAAALGVATKATNNATNNAAGADALSGNSAWPKDIFSSDLANRSRQQLRDMDALRGTPPVARKAETDDRSRRRSILGSIEREVPLRMYVDSWRQKIERNGNLNYSQVTKDKARGDPVAVVVLRSDGSVEEVTILRSSGRADLDEAVKRIVRVNAPYAAFPPNIAAKYDVIEIRRVWSFEETLKLVEELR